MKIQIEKIIEKNITIDYDFFETVFGKIMIASTPKGVCYLGFESKEKSVLEDLKSRFPQSVFTQKSTDFQQIALNIAQNIVDNNKILKLHIKGTDFQFKVWDNLLKIPFGELSTYGKIATEIGLPKACRAVGTAVGSNPVSIIIPCHRVVQTSGKLGGYYWGIERKKQILAHENTKAQKHKF
ncbi:MAG: methylated-DNA--[protein]-cysteine S-methyltransferase [Prevotellaceae bacterium]|jgi:AraC family transcriptional regulator of adaptative response/methylated-DNA-[protein]-cysteine methyltransferase|nr:methylated-DNA--[protein]-cysteine S-methyltransferase [Prevotellaceae bacterium]